MNQSELLGEPEHILDGEGEGGYEGEDGIDIEVGLPRDISHEEGLLLESGLLLEHGQVKVVLLPLALLLLQGFGNGTRCYMGRG